jgi:hypothetical protein
MLRLALRLAPALLPLLIAAGARGDDKKPPRGAPVAGLLTDDGSLLRRTAPGQPWEVVKQGNAIPDGDLLLGGADAAVMVKDGSVKLALLGDMSRSSPYPIFETAFSLDQPDGVDMDVTLERGRIDLTNTKEKGAATVRVRLRGKSIEILLTEPGTRVALEVYGRWLPGQRFHKEAKPGEAPALAVVLLVIHGEALVNGPTIALNMKAPPGPALVEGSDLGHIDPKVSHLDKLPAWAAGMDDERSKRIKAVLARFQKAAAAKGVSAALDDLLKSSEVGDQRSGIVLCGALDELPRLCAMMQTARGQELWELAIVVIRHWIGRGPGQDQRLYKGLIDEARFEPHEAEIVMHLLHGFTDEELARPETYQVLLKYMKGDRLFLRALAHWHLCCLAPQGHVFDFDPNGPADEREKALAKWRKLIPPGELPPKAVGDR